MSAEIATFRNAAGLALHCMLHRPPSGVKARDVACLLLSPGVKMRVAPHRLYSKLVDVFLQRGISVLRVDFHGLGDSEGELAEKQLDQLYRQVQLGRHVGDAISAMDYMQRECGIKRFIIGGLCGGAMTGLLAAERDKRIIGLYAIGIPVILDGTGAHAAANMTKGQLESVRGKYKRRLLNPEAWLRLFTFKTDFRLLYKSVLGSVLGKGGRGGGGKVPTGLEGVPPPRSAPAANLNPGFPRALFKILKSGTPALLLFSGSDRLQWEYQEKFAEPWGDHLPAVAKGITLEVIPAANHVLSEPEWISAAKTSTAGWLDARFAAKA